MTEHTTTAGDLNRFLRDVYAAGGDIVAVVPAKLFSSCAVGTLAVTHYTVFYLKRDQR